MQAVAAERHRSVTACRQHLPAKTTTAKTAGKKVAKKATKAPAATKRAATADAGDDAPF